jgi:hypothetical protein
VSVVTTFKEDLAKAGVIFGSISEAIRERPGRLGYLGPKLGEFPCIFP